jgi:hypothetical protein
LQQRYKDSLTAQQIIGAIRTVHPRALARINPRLTPVLIHNDANLERPSKNPARLTAPAPLG